MSKDIPNPGSAVAIGRGCICDFIKNDFGRGNTDPHGLVFYCTDTCPVHGILLNITTSNADVGPISVETKAALKWLKSRVENSFRRRWPFK
jgi:hypothetical protein